MTFLSLEFLVFLPIVLLAWNMLTKEGITPASILLLAIASAVFYSWGHGIQGLTLVLCSALANYGFGLWIGASAGLRRKLILCGSILSNCLFLAYYKYASFLVGIFLQVSNIQPFSTPAIFLLGISFFTLQQIAYLVIVNQYGAPERSLLNYLGYILFFPKIVAGPIVYSTDYFGQFSKQWEGNTQRSRDLSVGIALFAFGAFKKLVLSENIGTSADLAFQSVGHGNFSLLSAWVGILSYTLQLYFDFSGYCDMSLGVARMFGIKLPQNFNSPLRATSLVEFWKGWHMTMTRFFTDHIYNPIAIRLTRALIKRGAGRMHMFMISAAIPTLITFAVSGIWHGAGWNFLLFGLVHGIGLTVNQLWKTAKMPQLPDPIGWVLMLLTVMVSFVFFRAPDISSAILFFKGLVSSNVVWPEGMSPLVSHLPGHIGEVAGVSRTSIAYVVLGFLIVLLLPNPQYLLRNFEPSLRFKANPRGAGIFASLNWSPTTLWALTAFACMAFALKYAYKETVFIYYQF
ncbi:MBOAT family O-acyltransferase [Chromobacterium phragmitis]|uniref:MBOAT family O-acyltransferase n=1 Tax=Chromobacterium phragmitis TaxID=2202141 RepID=UPI003878296D